MHRITAALLLLFPISLAAQEIAKPLRKFDQNRDGKLTGDELTLARQAHNRGGREAEPRPGKWKEMLQRFEKDFATRRQKDFDLNADGKLDDREKAAIREVWAAIAPQLTTARISLTAKYDRNDDGELTDDERRASRNENESTRRAIEEQCLKDWRAKNAAATPRPA